MIYLQERLYIKDRGIVECIESGNFQDITISFKEYDTGEAYCAGPAGRAAGKDSPVITRVGGSAQIITSGEAEVPEDIQFPVFLYLKQSIGIFFLYLNS